MEILFAIPLKILLGVLNYPEKLVKRGSEFHVELFVKINEGEFRSQRSVDICMCSGHEHGTESETGLEVKNTKLKKKCRLLIGSLNENPQNFKR